MKRAIHLFPFSPFEPFGGSLRLRTSVAASDRADQTLVLWWDASAGRWETLNDLSQIATRPPATPPSAAPSALARLKRRVFPSTLWESGRSATAAIVPVLTSLGLGPSDLVVLHTSYLAGSIPAIRATGASAVCDVHDLVWRAHRMDANGLWAPIRLLYAATVRVREERLLRQATGLLVVGWADATFLTRINAVAWAPVGMSEPQSPTEPPGERIRIGLIGSFDHSATVDTATRLVRSRLGQEPDAIQLVFAGRGSETVSELVLHARALGPVEHIEDFYGEIDAMVAPVSNGSGMKCKLAEAVLAQKLVVTTDAGASGYPPELRRHFVVADLETLGARELAAAVHRPAGLSEARQAFADSVGIAAAAQRTRVALGGRWGLAGAPPALEERTS